MPRTPCLVHRASEGCSGRWSCTLVRQVQDFGDLLDKRLWPIRLLKEGDSGVQHPVVADGLVRVPGGEEHAYPPPALAEVLGELPPAHSRHDHIREQEVDTSLVTGRHAERLLTTARLQHLEACTLQDPGTDSASTRGR